MQMIIMTIVIVKMNNNINNYNDNMIRMIMIMAIIDEMCFIFTIFIVRFFQCKTWLQVSPCSCALLIVINWTIGGHMNYECKID